MAWSPPHSLNSSRRKNADDRANPFLALMNRLCDAQNNSTLLHTSNQLVAACVQRITRCGACACQGCLRCRRCKHLRGRNRNRPWHAREHLLLRQWQCPAHGSRSRVLHAESASSGNRQRWHQHGLDVVQALLRLGRGHRLLPAWRWRPRICGLTRWMRHLHAGFSGAHWLCRPLRSIHCWAHQQGWRLRLRWCGACRCG